MGRLTDRLQQNIQSPIEGQGSDRLTKRIAGEQPKEVNFLERLKLGFGGKEAKEKQQELETQAGLKGKVDVGDIADIAGESLVFLGATLGGIGGTLFGTPISSVPGAAIGAAAGEATKQAIGTALGVSDVTKREDLTIPEKSFETIKEPIKTGLFTLIGGKILGKIGGYLSVRIPRLGSLITGQSEDIVREAAKNPHLADQAIQQGDEVLRGAVEKGKTNTVKMLGAFIKGHIDAFKKLTGSFSNKLTNKKEIQKTFLNILEEKGVKINPFSKDKLDFSISKIKANPGEIGKIKSTLETIENWDDWTLSGVNRLKQIIGSLRKFEDIGGKPSKSPSLGKFYSELNDVIKNGLPKNLSSEYKLMNKKFENNIELYEDMVKAFHRGDPFTKLANVFSKNKDSLRQTIQFYEQQSGQKISPIIAGRELSQEGQWALFNPRTYVDFFYSPKAQAETITGIGKGIQKISPFLPLTKKATAGISPYVGGKAVGGFNDLFKKK